MAQPYRLPPRGASGAPSFDPNHPQTLLDFFEDLEYMLQEAGIVDDQIRKTHAVRYAPSNEKLLWRQFKTFEADRSYDDFKREVIREYLGDDGKRLYSIGDLKVLVEEASHETFRSASEFKGYSRRFRIVADYLVKHDVLRNDERDRLFLKGLPMGFREQVLERLKVKCPDVLAPRQPYSVEQVTAAAEFVLDSQDEDAPLPPTTQSHIGSDPAAVARLAGTATPQVKSESLQLAEALNAMAQAVALLHQQRPANAPPARQMPPHLADASSPRGQCHYCGEATHIIRRCPQVEADTAAGLVKRNEAGQVVLASGSYVPSAIPGASLRERVHEYYRQHPDARPRSTPSAPQLLFEPVAVSSLPTAPTAQNEQCDSKSHQRSLRRYRRPLHGLRRSPTNPPSARETRSAWMPTIEHPFRDVPDATYAPPTLRNYGLPPPAAAKATTAAPKKNDAAYRSFVPVYDPKHAREVFRRCLQTPTSLTLEELLALSPEIRHATREACSTRQIPVEDPKADTNNAGAGSQPKPPPGSLVIGDPADGFLKTCPHGHESLPPLATAVNSSAIRAIEGTFKDNTRVSCILDSGSAIISMSEGLCHALGLAYDPSVILHMQSANGETNPSLGLARNVPVRFGTIVVYLQFHVIRSPAYDVLLGRPFDVLTESVVQTFGDGTQTITLHDPNSDIVTKVPTLPRRPPEFARLPRTRAPGFHD
ncbi:hypothetical protein C8Q77DRAFT_1058885 [Trametes polyzona]|nr:hypothetical protein C8Q77DRAFT_1058885 [Trametes polyzona]